MFVKYKITKTSKVMIKTRLLFKCHLEPFLPLKSTSKQVSTTRVGEFTGFYMHKMISNAAISVINLWAISLKKTTSYIWYKFVEPLLNLNNFQRPRTTSEVVANHMDRAFLWTTSAVTTSSHMCRAYFNDQVHPYSSVQRVGMTTK